jgi:hypothetical protein
MGYRCWRLDILACLSKAPIRWEHNIIKSLSWNLVFWSYSCSWLSFSWLDDVLRGQFMQFFFLSGWYYGCYFIRFRSSLGLYGLGLNRFDSLAVTSWVWLLSRVLLIWIHALIQIFGCLHKRIMLSWRQSAIHSPILGTLGIWSTYISTRLRLTYCHFSSWLLLRCIFLFLSELRPPIRNNMRSFTSFPQNWWNMSFHLQCILVIDIVILLSGYLFLSK